MAGSKAVKKVASLVAGLRECWPDFNMTANELINPTRESIVKFYERFVHELRMNPEAIIMVLKLQNQYDYKDYDDIMYVYVLYSCVNHLLDLTSLQSFTLTLKDLINPSDDKNLVTRISLLANYLYFVKIWTEKAILPIRQNAWEEVDAVNDLNKRVSILNDQIMHTELAQSRNVDKIKKVCNEIKILNNEIIQLQSESELNNREIQTLKDKLKLPEDENDKLIESLEKNMMIEKQFESLIVDDSESILAEYHKLENDLAEEEAQLKAFVKTLELKTETYTNLLKNNEVVNNFTEILHLSKVLDTYQSIEEQRSEKERINKEKHIAQISEKEVSNLKIQLNHELSELEEQFEDLALQSNNVKQSLDHKLNQLNNDYENISKQFERSKSDAEELNKSLKYVQNCCQKYKEGIEKQDAFYEKLYSNFLTEKRALDDKVVGIMSQIKEIVKIEKS